MACTADNPATNEFEFVRDVHTRTREFGECRGPLLRLSFSAWRLAVLEDAFESETAHELLWAGFHPEHADAMDFTVCAVHWMDLSCLVWLRARRFGRADWHAEADQLLRDACSAAGWDPKEIVNMFAWQRARLT